MDRIIKYKSSIDFAIERRDFHYVLKLSDHLISSDDLDDKDYGYWMKGFAYGYLDKNENGEFLGKSIYFYKKAASIASGARKARYLIDLSHALIKQHGEEYNDVLKYLEMAASERNRKYKHSIFLAYGYFYENMTSPDLVSAKKNYLRAAFGGKLWGFFGFSRVSRKMGKWFQALICDIARIILAIPIVLMLGKKSGNFTYP